MSRRREEEKNDTRKCSGTLHKVIGVSSLLLNKSAIDWSEARGQRGIAVRLAKTVKKSLTQCEDTHQALLVLVNFFWMVVRLSCFFFTSL